MLVAKPAGLQGRQLSIFTGIHTTWGAHVAHSARQHF